MFSGRSESPPSVAASENPLFPLRVFHLPNTARPLFGIAIDYSGRRRTLRSTTLISCPVTLARAIIVLSVMFWRPPSTTETYCCVSPACSATSAWVSLALIRAARSFLPNSLRRSPGTGSSLVGGSGRSALVFMAKHYMMSAITLILEFMVVHQFLHRISQRRGSNRFPGLPVFMEGACALLGTAQSGIVDLIYDGGRYRAA
jgi:hypothetical protein